MAKDQLDCDAPSETRDFERRVDSSLPSSSCSASKDTGAEVTTTLTLRLRLLQQHRSSLYPRNLRLSQNLVFLFHLQNRPKDPKRLRSTSRGRRKGTMWMIYQSSLQQRKLVQVGKVLVYRVYFLCCLRRNRRHLQNPHNRDVFSVEEMHPRFHSTQRHGQQTRALARPPARSQIYSYRPP